MKRERIGRFGALTVTAVFAVATGTHDLAIDHLALGELGTLAADCLARAVARGVYHAASLGAARGWRDVFGR